MCYVTVMMFYDPVLLVVKAAGKKETSMTSVSQRWHVLILSLTAMTTFPMDLLYPVNR
jgi:hypothetical protein